MMLLAFRLDILDLAGAGLIPRGGRAWGHRDDFLPVGGGAARLKLRSATSRDRGRWEVVVEGNVALDPWMRSVSLVGGATASEATWCEIVSPEHPRVSLDVEDAA